MAGGMFVFAAVDTQAKFLTETMHPIQIVWCRQLRLVLGCIIIIALNGVGVLRTSALTLQIMRGAAAAFSATLFVFAVKYVPLADAVAVSFVAPFIVTVMGAVILGEKVGLRQFQRFDHQCLR